MVVVGGVDCGEKLALDRGKTMDCGWGNRRDNNCKTGRVTSREYMIFAAPVQAGWLFPWLCHAKSTPFPVVFHTELRIQMLLDLGYGVSKRGVKLRLLGYFAH